MSSKPAQPIKLYRHALSGHCHRVELLLNLLELPYERIDIDLRAREQKRPSFLQLNRFGQVPVIDDGGTVIADSNAILVYLAKRYDDGKWLPADPVGAAQVQRWFSVAAGPLATGPAGARRATVFGAPLDAQALIAQSHALLAIVDQELAEHDYLLGPTPTLADIACYSYIAHAPEGNVSLESYAHVRAWLSRIEQWPNFVGMQATAVGLAA
ncbi:glutathione S-transferase family protein [Ralstonia mannitolilytica]|uniref:Maleylpyruvate isomerase n=1 Tax=Ralstonia mannitolilytica TaxID=105219 RepID=A0AAD2B5H8_9RALS|nr:glutathione S-transferase [Ralstonia mannitolilytica]ATG22217.1 glutathione S-transferase [Ralstonia pickettii]MBY4717133.1 glutathione S-transferase [Ralstonia mannitolilytica]CAJ0684738.1 Maleylpyruvate isomerase [Ralstonia mannitolilytica]CAJ0696213.1 Maleylpyruvate isomerase [Ralstonia mannitolilytica]CAJ0737093.1 Maleylpyruvate isomerase [Ralstonia mannitolilytica]